MHRVIKILYLWGCVSGNVILRVVNIERLGFPFRFSLRIYGPRCVSSNLTVIPESHTSNVQRQTLRKTVGKRSHRFTNVHKRSQTFTNPTQTLRKPYEKRYQTLSNLNIVVLRGDQLLIKVDLCRWLSLESCILGWSITIFVLGKNSITVLFLEHFKELIVHLPLRLDSLNRNWSEPHTLPCLTW
jgi:hypothetical protein